MLNYQNNTWIINDKKKKKKKKEDISKERERERERERKSASESHMVQKFHILNLSTLVQSNYQVIKFIWKSSDNLFLFLYAIK